MVLSELCLSCFLSLLLFLFFIIQDRKEIVGELQFAFVCFLVGQGRYFAFIYLCSLM